jgi:hypothetical protein
MTLQVPAGVSYKGGDGSSIEQAVIILGASESTGVQAEYAWLGNRFPSHELAAEFRFRSGGKSYDLIHVVTADASQRKAYFDISDFHR